MNIDLVTSNEELLALESGWNALAEGTPMRSWDWLATWWQHYGKRPSGGDRPAERQLYVLAVYNGAPRELVGIAPWYLERSLVKGRVLRPLGSGEVCTDHLSFVCRAHDAQRVASAVAQWLTVACDEWDRVELGAVDADDAVMTVLAGEFRERDCVASCRDADGCWVVDLPTSWNEYLDSLSKSHRKQLRQLERRVLESDRVRWHQASDERELTAAWEILVDLHQRRRRSLGEAGCFASRRFHDFHRDVAGRLLQRGQLRISWLELDGTPAAAEYHLADRHTTFAYQGGVDPDRLPEEPGRLSTILAMRAAISEGHRAFDFLRGDEPYKAHWRATLRRTLDYRIVPNRRLARLRSRVLHASGAVTDWVKQSAQLLAD